MLSISAANVKPADIRKWQNTLLSLKREETGEPYSQTYLKTVHNQVSALFNYGVRYYGLKNNPCHQAGAMGKKTADAMQFWTVEEFDRFLEAISNKGVLRNLEAIVPQGMWGNITVKSAKLFTEDASKTLHLINRAFVCGGEISNHLLMFLWRSMTIGESSPYFR